MTPTTSDRRYWRWESPRSSPGAGSRAVALERRGAHHGFVLPVGAAQAPGAPTDAAERWLAGRPILWRGALKSVLAQAEEEVRRTRRFFGRVRRGAEAERELLERLDEAGSFRSAGVTVDLGDPREVVKVYADGVGRAAARDLWAKLSWVSTDPTDASLRVRFSFGSERLLDWRSDTRRALAADGLAEALFPESARVAGNGELTRTIDALAGGPTRLSERIVYSNAPGGGAAFHHDGEPRQLGVLYAQLAGDTGWLALPKHELAEALARVARGTALDSLAGTAARARRTLEREPTPAFERLLNRAPRLTRALIESGAFYRLRRGDVLLLPSPSAEKVAWHSVFALGRSASLSHSYGIFHARAVRKGRRVQHP